MTIQQALQSALQHHEAGRLAEAEQVYRAILAVEPRNAGALHLLGVIAHQVGRNDAALELIQQAIVANPVAPSFQNNLGNVFKDLGRLEESCIAFRRAIELQPDFAEAHNNLGNVLAQQGRWEEAVAAYREALRARPGYAQAHNNLGNVLAEQGQLDDAIAAYRCAVRFAPDYADAFANLGNALKVTGQLDDAIAAYRRAIEIQPHFGQALSNLGNTLKNKGQLDEAIAAHRRAVTVLPESGDAFNNLGNALRKHGRLEEAVAAYQRAVVLKPDSAQVHTHLGAALRELGHLDAAIAAHRRALELDPALAIAHGNLGDALGEQGLVNEGLSAYERTVQLDPGNAESWLRLGTSLGKLGSHDAAIAALRRGLELKPEMADARSSYLFYLHYLPDADASATFEEHRRWDAIHARPLAAHILPHANDRGPERPLRVGYVSADFRRHSVASFLESLLTHHDPRQCEVFCYSTLAHADEVTTRLRRRAAHWREIHGMSDADAAELIRQDAIDLLVDLAGHTTHQRLLIFARKPAPVQITWLGYPDTTGLQAMDYRLTDAHADPAGTTEDFYTERLIRLPDCGWCYRADENAPSVNDPPAARAGCVTFGCFNVLQKINRPLVESWSRILQLTPGSRLLLKARYLQESQAGARVRALLEKGGIAPDRIELADLAPTMGEHLATYHRVDVALDTFPYHGTTTTCEALWMGVPVITLAGKAHAARVGVSLLSNVGLPELIALDAEEYVRIAVALSTDAPRLAELRASLRGRMAASPLMDGSRFARNVERAFRELWRAWCAAQG